VPAVPVVVPPPVSLVSPAAPPAELPPTELPPVEAPLVAVVPEALPPAPDVVELAPLVVVLLPPLPVLAAFELALVVSEPVLAFAALSEPPEPPLDISPTT